MKLRICNDAIRLRLTVSEVAAIADGGPVEARTRFPGGEMLSYALLPADVPALTAALDHGTLRVLVPVDASRDWACDEQAVSLAGQVALDGGHLELLVEKDFTCLVPRSGEDSADLFVNPASRQPD